MKLRFSVKYFLFTVLLFVTEVLIATVFKNLDFLRAYIGDVLVVLLMYTFILTFFEIRNRNILIVALLAFSVTVEILQYFKIAEILNLKPGSWQHIVVGTSFSWWDIVCYLAGGALIFVLEKISAQKYHNDLPHR